MTAQEFEVLLVNWAREQPDIVALILAGSRARGDRVDDFSDWDLHLISSRPARYHGTDWVAAIAPLWCAHSQKTPRNIIKVSAVFESGLEVDFVPLQTWQMKLVYSAMRHPGRAGIMPARLRVGIAETRSFLLGSGYRLLLGGKEWDRRLQALETPWPDQRMEIQVFRNHNAAFWQKAVWVTKKIARPEPRSAMHWLHSLVTEHVYSLLAEEAKISGRPARPEARKAEQWLDARRLIQTAIVTSPDQGVLAKALLAQIALFDEVSRSVAAHRGFDLPDYTPVAGWLRTELKRLSPSA